MALLLEYAKVLKQARQLQVNEVHTPGYTTLAVAASSKAAAGAALQEAAEFARNPANHPLTQEVQNRLLATLASVFAAARHSVEARSTTAQSAENRSVSVAVLS